MGEVKWVYQGKFSAKCERGPLSCAPLGMYLADCKMYLISYTKEAACGVFWHRLMVYSIPFADEPAKVMLYLRKLYLSWVILFARGGG